MCNKHQSHSILYPQSSLGKWETSNKHQTTYLSFFIPFFPFLKAEVLNYISTACNQGLSVHPEDILVQYAKYFLCLVLDAFNLN